MNILIQILDKRCISLSGSARVESWHHRMRHCLPGLFWSGFVTYKSHIKKDDIFPYFFPKDRPPI